MKRLAVLVLAMLGMLGTATAVPGPARAATESCSVDYLIASEASGIFAAQITVSYTGFPVSLGWTLSFKFVAPGQRIMSGWNGAWTQSGSYVSVTESSGIVSGNGSIAVGFVGTYVTVNPPPVDFVFDGVPCTELS